MAFEPQIKEIETKYKRHLEKLKMQTTVQVQTNGEKVEKVLNINSNVVLSSQNGNLIEGAVNASVLVLTSLGEIKTFLGSNNFSANLNNNLPDAKVFVQIQNLGIDAQNINDTNISFCQNFCLDCFALVKQKTNYVSSIETANQKIGLVEVFDEQAFLNQNFEISSEIDLPNSISKVLEIQSDFCLKDCVSGNDLTTINGELFLNLVYMTNDEKPKLKTQNYVTDFSHEVLTTGVSQGQKISVCLNLLKTDFEIDGELSSGKATIEIKNKFSANIFVETKQNIETVVDAFCPKKEMQMEYQSFVNEKLVCSKTTSDKIDGNFVLDFDGERIDKVVCAFSPQVVTKSVEIANDEIGVKGSVFSNVVYLLDDDEHTTKVANIEIPFESFVRVDDLNKDDKVFVYVSVKDIEARNKKAKEIDVLSEIVVRINVFREQEEVVTKNVVLGENRNIDSANLGIYVIDNAEDEWEVAKTLLVNPEVLKKQNPTLTFPITKPTQIVIYRGRN